MIVILDAGHGINTPGKRSPKGMLTKGNDVLFREFEFNRDIVRRVVNFLINKVTVHILVTEIEDISLPERCNRASKMDGFDCFGVSVHANAGGGTGYEIYTSKGETESDKIATLMYNNAMRDLPNFKGRKDTIDGDPDKEANFYILKNTKCPWVLPEFGFMDNKNDLAFISSTIGREKIAKHLANSIIEYVDTKK